MAAGVASGGLADLAAASIQAGRLARVAAAVAEGGTAEGATVAASSGTLIRIGAQAVAGAGTAVGLGAAADDLGTTEGGHSLLAQAAIGALFGSAYGVLSRNPFTASEAISMGKAARSLRDDLQSTSSLSAAGNPNFNLPILNDKEFLAVQDKDVPFTFNPGGKARYSVVGQLKSSPNPISRLGAVLGEDAVGNVGHSVNPIAASETAEKFHRVWFSDLRRTWDGALKEWADDQGLGWYGRHRQGGRFGEEVWRAVVNTDPSQEFSPAVARTAEKIRKLNSNIVDLANNPLRDTGGIGRPVKGFGEVPENPHYMMRIWDARKVNEITERFGMSGIVQWFKGSIKSAQPWIDDDLLEKLVNRRRTLTPYRRPILTPSRGVV
jgi:hypothetical protein